MDIHRKRLYFLNIGDHWHAALQHCGGMMVAVRLHFSP
jgi:hypothetical protein